MQRTSKNTVLQDLGEWTFQNLGRSHPTIVGAARQPLQLLRITLQHLIWTLNPTQSTNFSEAFIWLDLDLFIIYSLFNHVSEYNKVVTTANKDIITWLFTWNSIS